MTQSSPLLSVRTITFTRWQFGQAPYTLIPGGYAEASTTFVASLASMGLGVGFALSAFRFFLFREPGIRRLDFVLMLFQV